MAITMAVLLGRRLPFAFGWTRRVSSDRPGPLRNRWIDGHLFRIGPVTRWPIVLVCGRGPHMILLFTAVGGRTSRRTPPVRKRPGGFLPAAAGC